MAWNYFVLCWTLSILLLSFCNNGQTYKPPDMVGSKQSHLRSFFLNSVTLYSTDNNINSNRFGSKCQFRQSLLNDLGQVIYFHWINFLYWYTIYSNFNLITLLKIKFDMSKSLAQGVHTVYTQLLSPILSSE